MSAYSYLCLECGERQAHYLAQCPKCSAWGALVSRDEPNSLLAPIETDECDVVPLNFQASQITPLASSPLDVAPARATPLAEIRRMPSALARTSTGYREVDRVLGGGIVDGAPILLAAPPGAGKTTCALGIAHHVAIRPDADVVYVTGEQMIENVAQCADRIGVTAERLSIVRETNLERVLALAARALPKLLIVDSAQVIRSSALPSEAGSPHQVRACVARLSDFASETKTPVLIIGHVTKDGDISGPKTLEHLVDVVLYLDVPDPSSPRRYLSTSKNRHGNTAEIGVLEMTARGIIDATAESDQRPRQTSAPGSILCPVVLGERVAIVEIEALVGPAREGRVTGEIHASGFDRARIARILAILARHTSIDVTDRNVYVSTAGGLRVSDPAADLAIALAIAGSARDHAYAPDLAVCGELALSGEVRQPVPHWGKRAAELVRVLGHATVPASSMLAEIVRGASIDPQREHGFAGDGVDCMTCGEGRAHYLHVKAVS